MASGAYDGDGDAPWSNVRSILHSSRTWTTGNSVRIPMPQVLDIAEAVSNGCPRRWPAAGYGKGLGSILNVDLSHSGGRALDCSREAT